MKKQLVVFLAFWGSGFLPAQEVQSGSIEQFIEDIYEQYTAESEEEADIGAFYEILLTIAENQLELNSATREELEMIPFLSALQVENILYHRYTYGAFTSLYELQLVEGLDMTDIRRMLPFVRLGNAPSERNVFRWWEIKKYGRHEVFLRNDLIHGTKKGFRSETEPPAYTGNRLYNFVKYRFEFRNQLRFSLTAEKDAGERWWNKNSGSIDFLSSSLQLRFSGPVDNIILGDFTAGFGQGLVLRQGFRRSKSSMATQVMNTGNGFKRFASTNEHLFFRGLAISAHTGKLAINAFLSSKKIDATFEDSLFNSIYVTGYHRTINELEKTDKAGQFTTGLNINGSGLNYELGISAVYTRFSHPLQPDIKPYNLFYFRGTDQLTTGIHYRYRWSIFNFFGETAITHWPNAGTVNGISFSPSSRVSVALVQRYYGKAFQPLFASAFAAQSGTRNEKGVYIGLEIYPLAKWKISAYADSYRFSWLKYGVDAPSTGNDFLVQLNFNPTRKLKLSLRNRYRKQYSSIRTIGQPLISVEEEYRLAGRFQLDYTTGNVQLRNALEVNNFQQAGSSSTGYAAWQDVAVELTPWPVKVSFRYLFFNSPSDNNRVYTYEKDVLQAFSSPFFSGKGSRYYIVAQYDVNDWASIWLKGAQVHYADGRTSLGSGNEEIRGDSRSELHLLVRFRFRNH